MMIIQTGDVSICMILRRLHLDLYYTNKHQYFNTEVQ